MNANFDNLNLLTAWVPDSTTAVTEFITKALLNSAESSAPDIFLKLYFIDATNSFPISQFQETIPICDENNHIYENIRITTCLDLNELLININKMTQLIAINRFKKQQKSDNSAKQSIKDQQGICRSGILVFINGIEIMFRNSQIKSSNEKSHYLLREAMLKLRVMANQYTPSEEETSLKTVLQFPVTEVFASTSKDLSQNKKNGKRMKNKQHIKGNTVGEYICKFYVDQIVS
ncbi:hypothetical protein TPHA_0C03050 [Tetrapisispora phaffii CBS 4417]|uniref:Uncharacterized protein n=1 Tax=Tetrapisispora phaffii (strain ATCC 24235 / CBS 4417 / NBRC 1672 / NRRL Y-8282 / UCD 70-5) TaxID=1071381 RepID=G8BRT2_TETPH|nr:hypothetical protein TPHA_0C03050 [Tetrapisispora phaffii CBS 4417]CCE62458.1 hypothetical protein TPHA_0C03050 [Tetrapisispora phaffii CBS 4417]